MTKIIQLPKPASLRSTFSSLMKSRRSKRDFAKKALTQQELSTLLFHCAGISDKNGHRVIPSARNCQEVDAYVFDKKGVWKFDAKANTLTPISDKDKRAETTLGQAFVTDAPVTLCFASDEKKSAGLIGSRAERCMALDAGAMMLASQLAATAMGLASVPRAGFDVEKVQEALGLGKGVTPLVLLTVGVAK